MANHTDFDYEIIETWEELYGGQNSGDLTVDYGNVRWEHKAYMNNISTNKKIITEDINGESELNEIHEYFRAETNMAQSFKMNAKNYKTDASIELKPKFRFPRLESGKYNYDKGTPKKLSFPHIGTKVFTDDNKTPLPSNASGEERTSVSYVHTNVTADIRMCTYFSGDVTITQDHNQDDAEINGLLDSANIEHYKTDSHGDPYFESTGTISIEIRRLQHPS